MKKKVPGIQSSGQRKSLASPRNKTILIADDDAGIRDVFSIIFESAGYTLDIKTNGEDILQNRFSLPDVFLIDKQLSGMNGLDVCRHLKQQGNTRNIPVIMISASPDIGRLALAAGADDYIEKPFDVHMLLDIVRHHVGSA